jgi:hypothetical protein
MSEGKRAPTITVIIIAIIALCVGSAYLGFAFSNYQSRVAEQSYGDNQEKTGAEQLTAGKNFQQGYAPATGQSTPAANNYVAHDPSYQEMKDFLAADVSDTKPYLQDGHICTDYTADVVNNAGQQNIRCAAVYIIYQETGHSIVAFNTTDKGLIFVEPQYDKEVRLVIGQSYSRYNNFVMQGNEDDTIVRWIIIW